MLENKAEWFSDWFDTPYYHALYSHRNDDEAQSFISRLLLEIQLPENSLVADIACGKGRHSRTLASHGLRVRGYDLSPSSIAAAQHEAKQESMVDTEFIVHDMRLPYGGEPWDSAFNLFTSFGYFQDEAIDHQVLEHIVNQLKPGAWFVQDYLHAGPLMNALPQYQQQHQQGWDFDCRKYQQDGCILKDIRVSQNGMPIGEFQERVQVYSLEQLLGLHAAVGLETQAVWGDYQGGPFRAESSPRMVLLSRKKM